MTRRMRINGGCDYGRSKSGSNAIEKTSAKTKNGNGHLFNEILPPVERTFPFSSSQATNLALPSTLKRTCTQCHEKKWIRVKRVSYVSDFMDFAYTFYFYLLFLSLTLFTSLHLIRFIVLPFIKCKRDQKCHRQRKKTDLSMKRNGNSNSCFHFNR